MSNPTLSAPTRNEIELSLFGPGVGECIVIHLGDGEWMIVDSCRGKSPHESVALDYLNAMSVDIEKQVRLIVVSHWHDDHIRGMASLVERAHAARFACAAALGCEAFFTLVAADPLITTPTRSSGTAEFAKILNTLRHRNKDRAKQTPLYWAAEGQRIYKKEARGIEVWALSPSHETVTRAAQRFGKYVRTVSEGGRRIEAEDPNEHSVVLQILAPGLNLLLGADLPTGNNNGHGWKAIIQSEVISSQKSEGYKVAHHGSPNADLPAIWQNLLSKNPYAFITPYARGRKPLPSPEDIARIKRHTEKVYCTAWPPETPPGKKDSAVEQTIREMTKQHWSRERREGHIQLRFPMAGRFPEDTIVSLFNGAVSL
jgi:beta-lactamase superfamily II metal-dependent hydrolase